MIVTRFAPSPTGLLHLGSAYSALFAWDQAQRVKGRFLLRIEDIDDVRCKPQFETAMREDLAWLGLRWEEPVRRQSEHRADYAAALDRLKAKGVIYPCFCTRADIARFASAPHGIEPIYPGTCRGLAADEIARRQAQGQAFALRLDSAKAAALAGPLDWRDLDRGVIRADPASHGDVVLARKDIGTSYHLAVTLDDHLQGVTLVTRGEDLLPATHIHRLLQALLDLNVPDWRHHRLIRADDGERLAKRTQALAIRSLRENGETPESLRARLGL
ncbi:MAG: tRNA glutamyl-Q(34) synthetase GluQRS [Alphaproteobacteria bacterium]|nr:tRNA glutamyl-Q(34) synthetase GluQRS [Alphaproteobacteria bacterium]